MIGSKSTPA